MKKPGLVLLLAALSSLSAGAQTLFTYGKHKADSKEFLRAFDKNNQPDADGRKAAIRKIGRAHV